MKKLVLVFVMLVLVSVFVSAAHPVFSGLGGIAGKSVKPVVSTKSSVPARKSLVGGIASGLTASKAPCADFGCKPYQYVVGDVSAKVFYRCFCSGTKTIAKENVKCFDSPAIAQKTGLKEGKC